MLATLNGGAEVHENLLCLSQPPSPIAYSYMSFYAFGNHFRVDHEEHVLQHATDDCSMAIIHELPGELEGNLCASIGSVDHVGVVVDILHVQFYRMRVILLKGSWVPSTNETCPSLIRDAHGYWLANLDIRPRDSASPYVFPRDASHVFSIGASIFHI